MPTSEFDLIAKFFAPLATSKAALGLKDDVALLTPKVGRQFVLTTDTIVEGIDFFADHPPDTIARKALRVNLSDLAAKGAKPEGYLLTLSLPPNIAERWLWRFARGLAADQETFGIALLGGDLSSTPGPLSITVAAVGSVRPGRAVLRRGARRGDLVFVTGTIGDSGGGLDALKTKQRAPQLIARYRLPEPRLAFGQKLRAFATAAIDVSDGLLADAGHLADVSKVHIGIDSSRIPLSPALRKVWGRGDDAILRAAIAGDDYEILFTAPNTKRAAVLAAGRATSTAVTQIGFVMDGRGVALLDGQGKPIPVDRTGWQHF